MEEEGEYNPNEVPHECESVCNSEKHSSNLTAALTKDSFSDSDIAAYWKWCCVRYPQAVDENGRTLLHMAAAKGRTKLLKFLLAHPGIDIHKKDKESNFSALHCSVFYGHIDCTVHLLKAGADMEQLDSDNLTVLDHISFDNPGFHDTEIVTCPHDVFVWGSNEHFNLGLGDARKRSSPDPLDFFKRLKVHFTEVILSKYHSAFLSLDGRLWMCGQGYGGRLGFEAESHTPTPKLVTICSSRPQCDKIALGRDHTVALMVDKTVWSFGLNTYHQLGHDPPPEKITKPRFIRGLRHVGIIGVSAAKFHSAFWTETQLYTCGLNGGQLGHPRDVGDTVIVPKPVSGLRHCSIKLVTCTAGATVVANNYGEIYLFCSYICRKITSRPFMPELLRALGGNLDHTLDRECLKENGGKELEVLVVTSCSNIYIWKESDHKYLKYDTSLDCRVMRIADVTFHGSFLMIVTNEGRAYCGKIIGERTRSETSSESSRNYIELTRIPMIHRAVKIAADPKGNNYAIVQYQPTLKLDLFPLTTNSEIDTHMRNLYRVLDRASYFQDVEFEVNGQRFAAHRYIVGYSSRVLEKMMDDAARPDGTCIVKIDNVPPKVFRALLCFIYTKDYNLASPCSQYCTGKPRSQKELDEMTLPFEFNGQKYVPVKEPPMTGKERLLYVKLLEKASRTFGVRGLSEELPQRDVIFNKMKSNTDSGSLVRFDRERFPNLWDTTLRSEDGREIRAHKCILVSRSEYFNGMMNNNTWRESTNEGAISIHASGKVLSILINYLYTGAAPLIAKSEDIELIFLTLITADQVSCKGLKDICELTLSKLMNLENAADIYQIGLFYNSENIRQHAADFIYQNLGCLLEKRSLEDVHDYVLSEFSKYYRSRVEQMSMRHITPLYNAPEDHLIELIGRTEPVCIEIDKEKEEPRAKGPKRKSKQNRELVTTTARSGSLDSLSSEDDEDYPETPGTGRRKKTAVRDERNPKIKGTGNVDANPSATSEPVEEEDRNAGIEAVPGTSGGGRVVQGSDGNTGSQERKSDTVSSVKRKEAGRKIPALPSPKDVSESDSPEETDSSDINPSDSGEGSHARERSVSESDK